MKENKINYEKCHKKSSSELVPITSSNFHSEFKEESVKYTAYGWRKEQIV